MIRVEKHKIKKNNKYYSLFEEMARTSNNLYNHALFIIRQNFINNKTEEGHRKYLNYNAIDKIFKKTNEENYRGLPVHTAQQTLRVLDKNWKSFFKSIKDWKTNPNKYKGRPKLPKYKKKGGLNQLIFTNQQCKIKEDGIVSFPKACEGFTIKLFNADIDTIKQVRILPSYNCFIVEVIYDLEEEIIIKEDNGRYVGIDLGLDNFAAIASNISQGVLINGKGLKAKNKYFNQQIAKLKSQLDKCQKKQYISKRINQLYLKRNNIINDYLHKASRSIVDYCIENDISKVVIGHNKQQKQGLRMKNFVQIPIFSLIDKLRYKLEMEGIELIEVNEAYTSGTSFLDNELPKKENYNKERRVNRGLFQSNNGQLINADINGAYQILRKVFSDVEKPADNGFVYNPIRLDII